MHIDPSQLIDLLDKLPGKIRDEEKKVIISDEAVQNAKLKLEIASAKALLEANKPNATERKAVSIISTENERKELIKAEIAYNEAQSALRYLENRYISLRKISSIELSLVQANISGH